MDGSRLTHDFVNDLENLRAILQDILSPDTLAILVRLAETEGPLLHYTDPLWVSTVYEFLLAYRKDVMRREHIVRALAPLYLGRTGSFLRHYASAPEAEVEGALESLSRQFELSKPELIQRWNTSPR